VRRSPAQAAYWQQLYAADVAGNPRRLSYDHLRDLFLGKPMPGGWFREWQERWFAR
jgi:hypothetical protein